MSASISMAPRRSAWLFGEAWSGSRWLVCVATVMSLLTWWLLHRWWFMSGDDYLLITQGGDVGGRFSFREWLGFLAHEWSYVNGRTSDSFLRLVLRPGPWFYPLFAPIMLTACGLGVGALLAQTRRAGDRAWMYPVGLLIISFLAWISPSYSGDAIFWTAGAMNYVLPLGAVCLGLTGLLRVLSGQDIPWWLVGFTAVGLMLTDSLQELASGALGAVAVVVIVTLRARLSPKAWVMVIASLVAFAIHMSAPGLWLRGGRVADSSVAEGTVERLLHAVAVSSSVLWNRVGWLWLLLIAAMLWLGWTRAAGRLPYLAAAALCGFGIVAAMYSHRAPYDDVITQPMPSSLLPFSAMLTVLMAVSFALTWLALAQARALLGLTPVVAWAACVGSTVFVFGSGISGARVHFIPAALLLVSALAIVSSLTADIAQRWRPALAGVIIAFLALPSIVWADSAWVGLQSNYQAVQDEVIGPLHAAQAGETVAVPASLPKRNMSYNFSFLMPRYEDSLKIYFDLPRDITIINP